MVQYRSNKVSVQLHCCLGNNYISINANGQKKLIYHASVKSRECITETLLEHPELTIQKDEKVSQNGNSIIRHRPSTLY